MMPADLDAMLRRLVGRLAQEVDPSGVLAAVQARRRRYRLRRRVRLAAVGLVAVAATGVGGWGAWRVVAPPPAAGPPPTSPPVSPRVQTLAGVSLGGDLRVVLVATHAATADGASVQLAVEQHTRGGWRRLDQRLVGRRDGWSWAALSAAGSICRLAATDTDPPPSGRQPAGQPHRRVLA
jgi:hypothetical protein